MKKILLLLVVFNWISIPLSASVIISEDFSKFVLGSEDAPDLQNPVATESSPISSDLTNTPGWSGTLVYQAGGCAYIQMMGMLMPPVFDASNNEGNYTVKFRARSQDGSDCYVVVAGYGAYDGVTETVGSEWSDHSVLMSGGSAATMFYFLSIGNVLIDDIFVDDGGVSVPSPLSATEFTSTSFKANWLAVDNVDAYSLNVYTWVMDEDTKMTKKYLIQGARVEDTSYTVTGIDFGTPYYYTVASIKGDVVTAESAQVTVVPECVDAPVADEASVVTATGFVGNWSSVDIATKYYMTVSKYHKAQNTFRYKLLDTDYSRYTVGSIGQPVKELAGITDGDWTANMPVYANGMFGLNNQDPNLFKTASMMSPVYDLSHDNGRFVLGFHAVGNKNLKATVSTYKYVGDVPTLTATKDFDVTTQLKEYSFDFDGGTEQSFITITLNEIGDILYFDDMCVSVNLSEGDEIAAPVRTYETTETSCTADNLSLISGDRIAYFVRASYCDNKGYIPEVMSDMSNIVVVKLATSGVDDLSADMLVPTVSVSGDKVVVSNNKGGKVLVCGIDGRIVFSAPVVESELTFTLPMTGVYIIKAGNSTFKIVY